MPTRRPWPARRSRSSGTAARATPTRSTSTSRASTSSSASRPGSKSRAARRGGRPVGSLDVADAVKAADVIMILVPDTAQKAVYDAEIAPNLRPGPAADVRPRLQHPLRADRPAGHRRRRHGRPEGPRPPAPQRVPAGGGVPALFAVHRDASGTARARTLAYARALGSHPGRRPRDDLRRGDRDRPVRRAVRPVRWHGGPRQDGLRDARRGRLPARARLLRDACTSSSSSST